MRIKNTSTLKAAVRLPRIGTVPYLGEIDLPDELAKSLVADGRFTPVESPGDAAAKKKSVKSEEKTND